MPDELPPVCTPPKAGRIFASDSTGEGRTWVSAVTAPTLRGSAMPRSA
jgi:hypothetical protein